MHKDLRNSHIGATEPVDARGRRPAAPGRKLPATGRCRRRQAGTALRFMWPRRGRGTTRWWSGGSVHKPPAAVKEGSRAAPTRLAGRQGAGGTGPAVRKYGGADALRGKHAHGLSGICAARPANRPSAWCNYSGKMGLDHAGRHVRHQFIAPRRPATARHGATGVKD